MKLKYLLIIIGVLALIVVGAVLLFGNKSVKVSNISSFAFTYSNSNEVNGYYRYELIKVDNEYEAVIKPSGISEENAKNVTVSNDFMKQLEEILNKYNVGSWNGFNKADSNVLDGHSFSLNIHTDDNKEINASGYMKYPDNFKNVREELEKLFMDVYNSKTGGNND